MDLFPLLHAGACSLRHTYECDPGFAALPTFAVVVAFAAKDAVSLSSFLPRFNHVSVPYFPSLNLFYPLHVVYFRAQAVPSQSAETVHWLASCLLYAMYTTKAHLHGNTEGDRLMSCCAGTPAIQCQPWYESAIAVTADASSDLPAVLPVGANVNCEPQSCCWHGTYAPARASQLASLPLAHTF